MSQLRQADLPVAERQALKLPDFHVGFGICRIRCESLTKRFEAIRLLLDDTKATSQRNNQTLVVPMLRGLCCCFRQVGDGCRHVVSADSGEVICQVKARLRKLTRRDGIAHCL